MKIAALIPNALTLSRLALCPLIVYCQMRQQYGLGIGLFVIAGLSDFLDGFVARRLDAETELGAFLDPVCDKLLSLCFFTFLMTAGYCPPWFLGLLLAILMLQSIGFLLVQFSQTPHKPVLRPLAEGRWNTMLQFAWIGCLLIDILLRRNFPRNFHYSEIFHFTGYVAVAFFQVGVFFRYFHRYRRLLLPDLRLMAFERA